MAKNKLTDVRDHLIEALERLRDPDDNTDMETEIKRAQAVNNLGATLINSAKVEIDYLKNGGMRESGFFGENQRRIED